MKRATILFLGLFLAGAVLGKERLELPKPNPPVDQETGKVSFQEVVPVPDAEAKELRLRAKSWVATAFRSAAGVIQLDEEDRMILRPAFPDGDGTVWMTITIEFKDGRYRYTVTDIYCHFAPLNSGPFRSEPHDKAIEQFLQWIQEELNGKKVTRNRIEMVTVWLGVAESYVSGIKKAMAAPASKGADF